MNIKKRALGGFTETKDDILLVRANTVLQAMTGNHYFVQPNPELSVLQQAIENFQEALSVARRKGSPMDTAAKNNSRKSLTTVLQQLAFYVTQTAAGDLHKLLSSGFETNKYPSAGDVPAAVQGVLLRDGKQSGQMRLDFTAQRKVLLYEYRYTEVAAAEEEDWSQVFATTSSKNNIMAPLTPYERYYVQVRAINGYGKSAWSEAVSHVIR